MDLSEWIGSREDRTGVITPWPVAALNATLDRPSTEPREGEPLLPLWHWLYFLPTVAQAELGEEGHAKLGGFLPPVGLPRRMFAGGRFQFRRPLCIGDHAERLGTVIAIEEKQGKSGRLVFVTIRYEVTRGAEVCISEEQDLVYREAPQDDQTPPPGADPIPDAAWRAMFAPDEAMLFRFSALTFNSHRIHYDHPYTTEVEGYPGLIVHGPLIALLLADLAVRSGPGRLRDFSFRGNAPLFLDGPITLLGEIGEAGRANLSAWSRDRRLAMTATAGFES